MIGILLTLVAVWLFIFRSYYFSLLIFCGLVTFGFLIIPPAVLLYGAPFEKTSDLAIFYILAIIVSHYKTIQRVVNSEKLFKWIFIFLGFVLIDAIYSYQVLGYNLSGVLKVSRHYLFFLSFGVFILVPFPILTRLLHTIFIITVLQSVLFLLQIPTGTILLGDANNVVVNNMEQIGWVRYYNTPLYLIPSLFYFLFIYKHQSKLIYWIIAGILLATVVAPMHRLYILTVALVISVYLIFRQSNSNKAIYLSLLLLAGYGALLIDPVSSRLNVGLNDISKTFATGRSLAATDYDAEDTFAYRMAHLFERANYIQQKPERIIFGIGLLSEETKQAENLRFEAGLYNERIGRVAQVNTSDIAWSLLILHLGFFGTGLFIVLNICFIRFFYRNRTRLIGILGILTLSVTLLTSFTGTELLMIHFRVFLLLMSVISLQENKLSYIQNNIHLDRMKGPVVDSPIRVTQTINLI
ncbi:hypothetical protein [Spirosoma endophyticum]|uniref:O-antigen ligase n=1 Tax=Spirosoma endophyticum TaxID=662367 RepID=A0A1I1PUG0_9BACT|nr:hypothetical protein [Spirosoma endophyticum]SFD13496.1 hypothetical protein SAMN05216167_103445 [Spirosoma endophyticum]